MSRCQIELMNAGKPYPRTCQTCGLGGACVKGLERGVPDRNPRPLPEFDANGWCHDMSAAPRDAELHLYGPLRDGAGYYQDICRFFGGRWSVEWMDNYLAPTAWRPLPLPPVMEQDQ